MVRCIPLGQWEKAHALSNFKVKCGEYFYKIQSSEKKEEICDTQFLVIVIGLARQLVVYLIYDSRLSTKKSVSCPAGAHNWGQSGGRNLFFPPFFLFGRKILSIFFFFFSKMKKRVSSRTFF